MAVVGALVQPLLTSAAEEGIRSVLHVARDASGLPVQELLAKLNATEDSRRLFAVTMDAAQLAMHEHRLRMLGLSLAAASTPGGVLLDELTLVKAVAALEPAHLRLLKIIAQQNPYQVGENTEKVKDAWAPRHVEREAADIIPEIFDTLIGGLIGQGVAASSPIGLFGGAIYRPTPLGRRLLERAADAAALPLDPE